MIQYKLGNILRDEDVKHLYQELGWIAYTNDLPRLYQAIRQSLFVVTAWEEDKMIGLVRVVGDGLTIIYIQDILVLDEYQGKGIGSELMRFVLEEYKDVRQKVLLTDERPETRGFYEKMGFKSCDNGQAVAFAKFG